MKPILVTAFLYNKEHYQNINFYKQYGVQLLEIKQNKVVFMDKSLIDIFLPYENEYTKILPTTETDMYLYPYLNTLDHKIEGNINKDSNFFFSVMCNKTEWLRQAIKLQLYEGEQYIWIDFGIFKIFNQDIQLSNLQNCYNKVRIGHIWDLQLIYSVDIKRKIAWYFAGGLFGGNKNKLIEFADIMKETTLNFIKENNYLVWEVNLWYILYKDHKELFEPYPCDHNNSMVNNY
uniref:Uncharacterized protein n=1 Tax=viral metagenome TaxID=1070528 RepID=A0A6C0FBX3_9ZZZZ|tara:strand:+ start:21749 stop:22447 length:699 start_codon:yes stop_codon:yes gene_type:complete